MPAKQHSIRDLFIGEKKEFSVTLVMLGNKSDINSHVPEYKVIASWGREEISILWSSDTLLCAL